ncbi:hypothetical protein DFH06DRAFT_1296443 [Mycena polygramma]|nr:hypothetical protein DFH06DRAFT_1296443 [Mycena polygramma]
MQQRRTQKKGRRIRGKQYTPTQLKGRGGWRRNSLRADARGVRRGLPVTVTVTPSPLAKPSQTYQIQDLPKVKTVSKTENRHLGRTRRKAGHRTDGLETNETHSTAPASGSAAASLPRNNGSDVRKSGKWSKYRKKEECIWRRDQVKRNEKRTIKPLPFAGVANPESEALQMPPQRHAREKARLEGEVEMNVDVLVKPRGFNGACRADVEQVRDKERRRQRDEAEYGKRDGAEQTVGRRKRLGLEKGEKDARSSASRQSPSSRCVAKSSSQSTGKHWGRRVSETIPRDETRRKMRGGGAASARP